MDEHRDFNQPTKTCPKCCEEVNAQAEICRYCFSRIGDVQDGQQVRVRIQAGENIYRGNLYVAKTERLSDAINDSRRFIILSKVKQEGKLRDVAMDFLALNKDAIESVCLAETDEA